MSQPKFRSLLHCVLRWLRMAGNYELMPSLSRKARRVVCGPLGALVLTAVAAFLCGIFLQPQCFVLFGSLVAVIVVGLCWPWLSLWGLSGRVSFAKLRTSEGESVEARLTLSNALPWTVYGLTIRAGLDPDASGDKGPASLSVASVPSQQTIECRWQFTPLVRGVYPLTSPVASSGFPFGLLEKARRLRIETPLLVWPRTYPVGPAPNVGPEQQLEGATSRQRVGTSGDVLGVRPYRRGDSPRSIHWQQSARHDRLIVCELQANARPAVQLVLDTDPSVHSGNGPDSSREWAIRIIASLAKGWLADGVAVGAAWNEQVLPTSSGVRQRNTLLDALARLPDHGTPLGRTLRAPGCRNFDYGLQVIVTTDTSAVTPSRAEHQRWVVLRTAGFGGVATAGCVPTRRAITVEGPEQVGAVLLMEWV